MRLRYVRTSDGADHFGAARADHQARACALRDLLRELDKDR